MKKLLAILFGLLLLPLVTNAASRITATLTVTNAPSTNGMTITFNGTDTRTFSNSTSTASLIATNATIGGTATNIFDHLAVTPPSGATIQAMPATNQVRITGGIGSALAVTFNSTNIAVAYTTQTVASAYTVRVPITVEPAATNQTNIASLLVSGISALATNAFTETAPAMSNFVGLTTTQVVSGAKVFTGTNTLFSAVLSNGFHYSITNIGGSVSNGALNQFVGTNLVNVETVSNSFTSPGTNFLANAQIIGGSISNLGFNYLIGTNLLGVTTASNFNAITNVALGYPTLTNGINRGAAFQSYSNDSTSVMIGRNAYVSNTGATTIGYNSFADDGGVAIGAGAKGYAGGIAIGGGATAQNLLTSLNGTIAIGYGSSSTGWFSTAIGYNAIAGGTNALALGLNSVANYGSSFAIGYGVSTTDTNQIMLGDSTYIASFPGKAAFAQSLIVGTASRFATPTGFSGGVYLTNGTSASADPANGVVFNSASGEWHYRTSATSEGAGADNRVHNRGAEVVCSGADYSLTASAALIATGGTQPDINTLPTAGTYLIQAIVTVTAGGTANDTYLAKFYNATAMADIANSQQSVSATPASQKFQIHLSTVATFASASRVQVYGWNSTAGRGTVNATETKVWYVRLY
jgi:hypothetical protein